MQTYKIRIYRDAKKGDGICDVNVFLFGKCEWKTTRVKEKTMNY